MERIEKIEYKMECYDDEFLTYKKKIENNLNEF